MKSAREHLTLGIATVEDLRDALQLAMQLEFATIPPYLCAQWSIRRDPDRVEAVLHSIVHQEMNHLALAGNVLAAIGGRPRLAHAEFVPRYPACELPGGIPQRLPVDLRPLTRNQIEVFMQIEHPDFQPVALAVDESPCTIGELYDAIIAALGAVRPPIDQGAFAVSVPNTHPPSTVDEALLMLERIKEEGEGLRDSPDQPISDRVALAHYYSFKELYVQRRLVHDGTHWAFAGDAIELPDVYAFSDPTAGDDARTFRRTFSRMLVDLESCWSCGAATDVTAMFKLQLLGQALIRRGAQPEFAWDPDMK